MKFARFLIVLCLFMPHMVHGQAADYVPGELYVKYAEDALPDGAARVTGTPDAAIRAFGGRDIRPAFPDAERLATRKSAPGAAVGVSSLAAIRRVSFPVESDMSYLARKLSAHPAIEYAEPVYINYVCREPDDPVYTNTGAGPRQEYLRFVNAPGAWEISQGDSTVVIAIVDSGTDWRHEDLESRVWTNPGEIPGNGIDDDGNDIVDDVHGADLYGNGETPDGNPIPTTQPHGTHVAGIAAAATDNGIGIASLGWNLRFMPVKTGPDNTREIFFGYEGILYAAAQGAHIINCSWGSSRHSQVAADVVGTVAAQGVLIVAAAGNDSTDAPFYPAAYTQVIGVGSIDLDGRKSIFTNYGPFVDVYAPGSSIYSTLLNGSYGYNSGTSMAAPIVSSLAGLVKAAHPDWDMNQVQAQVLGTATPVPQDDQDYCGCAYIDAERALGPPVLHLDVIATAFSDSVDGDGDGLFRPGETIQARLTIRNFGEVADAVEMAVSSLTGQLIPLASSVSLGSFDHGDERMADDVSFTVAADTPSNTRELIRLDFTSAGGEVSYAIINVLLNPSYATFAGNTLELSFGDRGQLGFIDYPLNETGAAFIIHRDIPAGEELFETPLMFEGGLLFGAPDGRVSDSVRGEDEYMAETDFLPLEQIGFINGNDMQTGTVTYRDSGSDAYDVAVSFTGYAWDDPALDQAVLLSYTFRNDGDRDRIGARAGLFFDFDMPDYRPSDDQTYYVPEDDIIVIEGDQTEVANKLMVGVAAVPGIDSPWLIKNAHIPDGSGDPYFGIYDGFSDREKWLALSGGAEAQTYIGGTDVSLVAGVPAFNLPSCGEHQVGFVIAYGMGYAELLAQVQAARERATQVITAITGPSAGEPAVFALTGVYPNPFNQTATVSFVLPRWADTELAIYSVTGQRIRVLVSGGMTAGAHTIRWDGRDEYGAAAASGVYIIRLVAGGQTAVTRMTLLK